MKVFRKAEKHLLELSEAMKTLKTRMARRHTRANTQRDLKQGGCGTRTRQNKTFTLIYIYVHRAAPWGACVLGSGVVHLCECIFIDAACVCVSGCTSSTGPGKLELPS